MALVELACDLCGGEAYQSLYPSTIDRQRDEPSFYYGSTRPLAGHLEIVRCAHCGLARSRQSDDELTLQTVYSGLEDRLYEAEGSNRRRTAQTYLGFMAEYTQPSGKLLDVGCASGLFLEDAIAAGWEGTGLEPSAWACSIARSRLLGVEIIQAALEEATFPDSAFQAVSLWDVLEHVYSPTLTLRRLSHWLEPGGWLFLNVPDISSLPARLMGHRWVLLLREHLWYFTPATMLALLHKCGFQLAGVRGNAVHFSLANMLARLAQYPSRLQEVMLWLARFPYLKVISVKFPMGEMSIAAQKTAFP